MASKLADETLHAILSLVLEVPDDDFANIYGIRGSPFANRQYSTADTLLVCKRWMRVATPLLYDTVVLRSVGQAQALAKALKKNPEFAPFLKKLRVEGGFGASVGKVLHAASGLSDLCICLELNSKDNVSAMCSALPDINPARLILSSPLHYTSRAMTTVDGMVEALPAWTNLKTLVLPSRIFGAQPKIINSLRGGLSPSDVYLKGYVYDTTFVSSPLQFWPRCTVHLSAKDITEDSPTSAALLARHPSRIILHRIDPVPVNQRRTLTAAADPVIHRAPAEIQREVWTRVLFHVLRSHRDGRFRSSSAEPGGTNSVARCYMRVCKLFRDIGRELAVSHIVISRRQTADSLQLFLDHRPDLQSRVQSLHCLPDMGPAESASLIARTPGLRRLSCLLTPSDTIGMSPATAASLVELTLRLICPIGVVTPATLSFPALRRLYLSCSDTSDEQKGALNLDLPLLHELILPDEESPWLYEVVGRSQLPNIRYLSVPHADPAAVAAVLVAHGRACIDLTTCAKHVQLALLYCPKMQKLRLQGKWVDPFNGLDPALVHVSLTKLELPGLISPRYYQPDIRKGHADEVTGYFSRFVVHSFPSLQLIEGGDLDWPSIPREIPGSHVAKWAEMLHEKGIKLVDRNGKGWRPRVKTSRGG